MRPPPPRPASGRIIGFLLLGLFALVTAGLVAFQYVRRPESSPVSRGARQAEQAGCFACHGRAEEERRFNLRQASGQWRHKHNPSLWEGGITEASVLVDWITNGVPKADAEAHRQLFIRMPAYRDRLTPGEIEDIAAWILAEGIRLRAEPGAWKPAASAGGPKPSGDQLFLAGDRLARQTGCYQCHGELGQGGIANPGSLKGYIPGFQGKDFLELTAHGDRAEVLHWIEHGRGRSIESGPLGGVARRFLEAQAIPMPGYGEQLSPAEKDLLADYLLLLNKHGPLSAQEIERLTRLLDPS